MKLRRASTALAVAAATLVVPAQPAGAHFCAFPVSIEPGEPATVNVGVAAENTTIVGVAITAPAGFRVDRVLDTRGWTKKSDGNTVRFTGGRILPFECQYFALAGVADRPATLVFPLTIVDDEGTVIEYTGQTIGQEYAAQLVYARPPSASGDERSPLVLVVVAVLVVAGLALGFLTVRFGRRRLAARQAVR